MKLTTRKQKGGHASTEWLIHVGRDCYRFNLNARLLRDLGLRGGERIMIAKDEDSRNDWYMTIANVSEDGAKVRVSNRNRSGEPASMVFYNKAAANEILNSVKATDSATFIVAAKATKMPDGREWYRIMTAIPKKIR